MQSSLGSQVKILSQQSEQVSNKRGVIKVNSYNKAQTFQDKAASKQPNLNTNLRVSK
jgi:hypothetical protein